MTHPLPRVLAGNTLLHLEQLISGLPSGVILVDLSGAFLWANYAALAMHGVDRLEDLGSTADEYATRFALSLRNGHRLASREYPVMRVLAGENIPDLIVEVAASGAAEPKWTHHIRDVLLTGDDEDPDCLALVIQDVSEQFEAEERFEAMFQANPAPALILRLADQRFTRVNSGFLEMTGYARTAIVGRSLYDLDILNGAQMLEVAKERLAAGKTIPQMEAELPLPNGHTGLVVVAGQPIEIGDDKCMLFTFTDLEPRRRAENSLRDSEAHFSTLFQMAPVAMALTSPDGHRLIEGNEAFWRLTGYSAAGFVGRAAGDPELWADVHERNTVEQEIERAGGIRNRDVQLLDAKNHPLDCLLSAERMVLRGEQCTLWLFQDISARRSSELELVAAIEAVMKDASWFSRTIMDKLASLKNPHQGEARKQSVELTTRERQVLALICEGLDDKAIAGRLALSGNTVRNHVAGIYAKIGVNRRAAAVAWARDRGLS
ncbi:PAS domain-containing protein [Sphingomonas xinjiangensis]|uniref:PAS domain S-box-containing protein n=1 Tax=Sphingomonas xinjiangensis TaxID=643568 RepID=A0A840YTP5_9SPHN|nr:PAS domain-containing protein [Sphingomonas xinjiangensis]MBB5713038.1 PAS domain S-box-containing protein [Sphingomonas xinjiangensis]